MERQRKFGKYTVHVELSNDENLICITDGWFTNYGISYHACGLNPDTRWLFGMDAEVPRKDIKEWLQNVILSWMAEEGWPAHC